MGLTFVLTILGKLVSIISLVYFKFYLSKSISATVISDFQVTFKLSPKSRLGSHAH